MLIFAVPFVKTTTRRSSKPAFTQPPLQADLEGAKAALLDGDPARALALLMPELSKNDPVPESRLLASKALFLLGRLPEAILEIEAFLKNNPHSVEALLLAGVIMSNARELARAVDFFNKAACFLDDTAKEHLAILSQSGEIDPIALEELIDEVESDPANRPRVLALACALGKAGHFRAVEKFLPLLE